MYYRVIGAELIAVRQLTQTKSLVLTRYQNITGRQSMVAGHLGGGGGLVGGNLDIKGVRYGCIEIESGYKGVEILKFCDENWINNG